MPLYQYSPLESESSIRLIRLKPGCGAEEITCELEHVSLDECPRYQALSYTWDIDGTIGSPRHFEINCGKSQIFVTENLFSALHYIRTTTHELTLWVDAVSINQSENLERGQQVRIMHRIYAAASSVVVWLGAPEGEDGAAFNLIQGIQSFDRTLNYSRSTDLSVGINEAIEGNILPPLDSAPWKALASLFDKRYFYRRCGLSVRAEIDMIETLTRPHEVPPTSDVRRENIRDIMLWRLREAISWLGECKDLVDQGGCSSKSTDLLEEEFWQTINLSGFPGTPIPAFKSLQYYHSFKEAASILSQYGEASSTFDQDLNRIAREASSFEQAIALWSPRRLSGKTKNGYLGMFPQGSITGDRVFIIKGVPTPVVLRPISGDVYRFVGESYVHGFMKGEVFSMHDYKELWKDVLLQ